MNLNFASGRSAYACHGRRQRTWCRAALQSCALIAVVTCASARPLEVYGWPARAFVISVNQEIHITLRTLGPGNFISPPTLTGGAVQFIDVALAKVIVPAGMTQVFRFKGIASGTAILVFHNTNDRSPDVSDTVVVH